MKKRAKLQLFFDICKKKTVKMTFYSTKGWDLPRTMSIADVVSISAIKKGFKCILYINI